MDTKNIISQLRMEKGLSQDELAQRVMVTRQAVSRWETGETVPNTESLKLLSREFDVSINTLLGAPRQMVCQCCGMPIESDDMVSRESDGSFNENYCRWCYADGTYTYSDMDNLIDVCVEHMVSEEFSEEQAREYMKELLPRLDYWKNYAELNDGGKFEEFKRHLIQEINELNIEGMPELTTLNALIGQYVNIAYPLPSRKRVKFLDDQATYLGNQLESETEPGKCYGILGNRDFIVVCTYGEECSNPELLIYKKR